MNPVCPDTPKFLECKEWNIRPFGKLRPIYECDLSPTLFVIPTRWKVCLPASPYVEHLKEDEEELDSDDLSHDTAWEICTGYVLEEQPFKGSLDQPKKLLLGRVLDAFEYEVDPRRSKQRASSRRVFVAPMSWDCNTHPVVFLLQPLISSLLSGIRMPID